MESYLCELPRVLDDRGNLSFIEENGQLPFCLKRVYWISDVPGGQAREGHAFRTANELVVALSGSFDVVIHDGVRETSFSLNRSHQGLIVPCRNWRTLQNFSTNSLALILASTEYDNTDYIRNFEEFLQWRALATSG